MPIGGISVSAMHRDISSLRLRQSFRARVSGPLDLLASHVLGITEREEVVVQIAQVVLASTAARTLALGVAPNSSWSKDTVISIVIVMEKPVNH